jgi:hypothetical protein
MSHYLDRKDWRNYDLDDSPGVSVYTAPWMHAKEIAAVAADNYAVEVRPSQLPPFRSPFHICAIPNMGLTLGEIFYLEELATDCAGGRALRVSPGRVAAARHARGRHADQPVRDQVTGVPC